MILMIGCFMLKNRIYYSHPSGYCGMIGAGLARLADPVLILPLIVTTVARSSPEHSVGVGRSEKVKVVARGQAHVHCFPLGHVSVTVV